MPRRTHPIRKRRRGRSISLKALYKRDKGICYLCTKHVPRNEATRDHVHPKIKGGKDGHHSVNVKLTHESCNKFKGDHDSWVS